MATGSAETVGISKDRVGYILHGILGMKKLSAPWVSRLLTLGHKRNRETTSEQCLTLFRRNPKEFLGRFMTVDEIWIHWYTPETNALRRRLRLSHRPERWSPPFSGILRVWSTSTIWRRAKRPQGRRQIAGKTAPFGQEKSALSPWQRIDSHLRRRHGQTSRIRLRTAAWSTVLAKFGPVWRKFKSNVEVIAAKEDYFADLEKTYFSDELKKLEYRWVTCIELKGEYVEK